MLDPTPLPAEVATDEPPISEELLALVIAGVAKPNAEHLPRADEHVDDEDPERKARREAVVAATETIERWTIEDEAAAEWAGGHFARASEEIAEAERQAKEFHRRVDRWLADQVAAPARLKALMEGKLTDWGLRQRAASNGKTATFSTPSASVATRGAPKEPKLVIDGGKAGMVELVAWLEENLPDTDLEPVIKVEKSVLLTGLKAVTDLTGGKGETAKPLLVGADSKVFLASTGEQVPNVSADHGEISVTVSAR